jgi:hypothetical protein
VVSASHNGTVNVTVTATDAAGNTDVETVVLTAKDVTAPAITCLSPIVKINDAGVCGAVVTYTAPVGTDNCTGSTTTQTAGLASGATFPVGTTTNTFKVRDAAGNETCCSFTVTVIDNEAPRITNVTTNQPTLWPPNHKMKDVTVTINSSDNCGGSSTSSCKVTSITSNEPLNGLGDGNTEVDYEIVGDNLVRLRAERSGTGEGRLYTLTVTCTDGSGNTSTATTEVRVAHNITGPTAGSSVKIGSTINMAGTFWDVAGNRHTAKWLVDGVSVAGTVTAEPVGTKNGIVKGSYKLATAGVYKLQMNVTDQKGVTSYATTNGYDEAIVVAYDPNGGYTYGGKKFISPKGAIPSQPHVSGDMTYGFQTNYYKGATNPKGETWFVLNNGEFEFNALNVDYLVVTGAKAQFKGLGKMNRNGIEQSGIAFILTVTDGQLTGGGGTDKIRMKIYNKNTGEVYYDNQPGASDADAPVTVVENNSLGDGIVVVSTSTAAPSMTETVMLEKEKIADVPTTFGAKAYPNPSVNQFTVEVTSDNRKDVVRMIVYDLSGRIIERNNNLTIGKTIRLGGNYRPGVYIVEMIQVNNRKQLKLIKGAE